MPFTPFHFGPSAFIALSLRKYIDLPVLVLANVVIDFEPLAVMLLGLNYPVHGYAHTFLIGILVGTVWAIVAYSGRTILKKLMNLFYLFYDTSFGKTLISAILGIWLHVLFDALFHPDLRPFYPFPGNPMYGIISHSTIYLICGISFIPALVLYIIGVVSFLRKNKNHIPSA